MYAVLNPDGTFYELRDGTIETTTNTGNRQKRYAVPYAQVKPPLTAGEVHVFDRRDVTVDQVTDVFRTAPIPPPPVPVERKLDALTQVLVNKAVLTRGEIDAAL